MKKLRTAVLMIALVTLSSCGKEPTEPASAPMRPEQPPAITAVLDSVVGESAVTWEQFQELARWHRTLRSWPPADSRLLLSVREHDEKLADALLLYRDHDLEAFAKDAFIQYLTSTAKEVPSSTPHPDAESWLQAYADRLSVDWPPTQGEFGVPYSPAESVESLRSSLILINRARYGWDEVIPASIFGFKDNNTFGKPNAMWMAEMAVLAYHDEHAVRSQLALWDYPVDASFRWIEDLNSGTQGFVVWNQTRVILAFRGTKGFKDMKTDLLIRRKRVPWVAGGVHRGFSAALDAVWTQVESSLEDGLGGRKLFITGHSLGAALAQLAAIRLHGSGKTITSVYAFGSPLIGDDDFSSVYDAALAARTFPHINYQDAVTRIPPRWLGFSPVAIASTRKFVGPDHEMIRLGGKEDLMPDTAGFPGGDNASDAQAIDVDNLENESVIRSWFEDAEQDIQVANEFLAIPPDQLTAGSYNQEFNEGRVDDHGINQYLFKLGCAILEERWEEETARAKNESG